MSGEQNPYPPGSARAKLWQRREDERKKAEGNKQPPPPEDKPDNTKRRKKIDDFLDRAYSGQTTDSNNE